MVRVFACREGKARETQPNKTMKDIKAIRAIYSQASAYQLRRLDTAQLKKGSRLTLEEMKQIVFTIPK
jgi:hypothetical protein